MGPWLCLEALHFASPHTACILPLRLVEVFADALDPSPPTPETPRRREPLLRHRAA